MKYLILIMTILATGFAFAKDGGKGWMFNPFVAYSTSTMSVKNVGSQTTTSFAGSAVPVGMLVAYSWGGLYLGVESVYEFSGKTTASTSGAKEGTYDRGYSSLQVGYQNGRIHGAVEYSPYDAMTYKANGSTTSTKYIGTSVGGSIGYQFMNHLSVDLTYNVQTYTNYKDTAGNSGTVSSVLSTFATTSTGLAFVFPF
jgi:hypothetical protein